MIAKYAAPALVILPLCFNGAVAAEPPTSPDHSLVEVDRHIVIVIDRSSSMNGDIELAMKGFATSLAHDEEVKQQVESGVRFTISLVFFANEARHTISQIITSHEKMMELVREHLWDFEKDKMAPLPEIRDGTVILKAYEAVDLLFSNEGRYGFTALSRCVLITGDGEENDVAGQVKEKTVALANKYNAVVEALPVMQGSLYPWSKIGNVSLPVGSYAKESPVSFYEGAVRTPENVYYMAGKNGDIPVPVRAGSLHYVEKPADYQAAMRRAMNLLYW